MTTFGSLDYLVLNHIAVLPFSKWNGDDNDLTALQDTFDINFKAYVHLASHALPYLNATSGSIVVVSSLAGWLHINGYLVG